MKNSEKLILILKGKHMTNTSLEAAVVIPKIWSAKSGVYNIKEKIISRP